MATKATTRPLTLKQRRYVQALPTAKSQTEAAITAGYSPIGAAVEASLALRKPNVAAAIAENQEAIAEDNKITYAEVASELRREASAGNKKLPNAARVQAIMGKAKLGGLITERVKVDMPPSQVNLYLQEFSLQKLLELRDVMRKRLGDGEPTA